MPGAPGRDEGGDLLLHAALPGDWEAAVRAGEYRWSTRGLTLDEVGFVHCARADQLDGVIERFYADLDELVILVIDPDRLDAPVVDEPPADGIDELFPHVYGPIPVHAVVRTIPWRGQPPAGTGSPPGDTTG